MKTKTCLLIALVMTLLAGWVSAQDAATGEAVVALVDAAGAGVSRRTHKLVDGRGAAIVDFDAMNSVYDAWIDPANPPTRACVEARLADPDLRVEMTAVAAL